MQGHACEGDTLGPGRERRVGFCIFHLCMYLFVVSFATDLDVARGALCTDKATFLRGLLPPEVLSHFGLVQVVFL